MYVSWAWALNEAPVKFPRFLSLFLFFLSSLGEFVLCADTLKPVDDSILAERLHRIL